MLDEKSVNPNWWAKPSDRLSVARNHHLRPAEAELGHEMTGSTSDSDRARIHHYRMAGDNHLYKTAPIPYYRQARCIEHLSIRRY